MGTRAYYGLENFIAKTKMSFFSLLLFAIIVLLLLFDILRNEIRIVFIPESLSHNSLKVSRTINYSIFIYVKLNITKFISNFKEIQD